MKNKSDVQEFIEWFKTAHFLTISILILVILAFLLVLIRHNDFIYLPSGLFYKYTINLLPFFILFIVALLQIQPYQDYNHDGNKTWIYKQPLKLRKFIRFISNMISVSLITILIYYSLGILASYFPQTYTYYAYSTKVSWKEISHSKKRGLYQVGTEMTDNLIPSNDTLIYNVASNLHNNYFTVKAKTYRDLYINKKIKILSKSSFLWGEYLYDIDYEVSNFHYKNSTNTDISKATSRNHKDSNNTKPIHQTQQSFNHTIHPKTLPTIPPKTIEHPTYPKLIKYEK